MKLRKTNVNAVLRIPRCFVMSCPPQAQAGSATIIEGQRVTTLDPAVLADAAWPLLPVSFEEVYRELETLAGVFLEPDGSFTLTAIPAAKLEGQLNDEGRALAHVELWGTCRSSDFKAVLSVLGWPTAQLMFLLAEAGVYVAEQSLWQFIQGDRHATGDE